MNMNVANMNVAAIAPSTKGNKTMKAKQAPVLTAEELAMQTAKNAVQTARKEYTKELNEFKRICSITVVTDTARQEQAEKLATAQKAERLAQAELDKLSGNIEDGEEAYNRFALNTVDFELTSTVIMDLIEKKESENEKEDIQTIRNR